MILKFADKDRRQSFLELVQKERGDIVQKLDPAATLPHIIASDLNNEQRDWIVQKIEGYGRSWDDFQFDLFR